MGDSCLLDKPFFTAADHAAPATTDNLFSILEGLEEASSTPEKEVVVAAKRARPRKAEESSPKHRKVLQEGGNGGTGDRAGHIAVERMRRKQMNEHLSLLRSIMPCFYVKRGDQASIIGGVVNYIKELQQLLHTLEAKKQRKVCNEILSPRSALPSPRPSSLSPRIITLGLPISPETPKQGSPYRPKVPPHLPSSPPLGEISKSGSVHGRVGAVEVRFSGPHLVVKTMSGRRRGQVAKMVEVIEGLSLEILRVGISTLEDTMLNSFTIKIGVDCQLSAEELAQEIQQILLH